jgi:hypothetical protein
MTDLTTRELMDTISRSPAETRATFKKVAQPSTDNRAPLQPVQKEARPEETVDLGKR